MMKYVIADNSDKPSGSGEDRQVQHRWGSISQIILQHPRKVLAITIEDGFDGVVRQGGSWGNGSNADIFSF